MEIKQLKFSMKLAETRAKSDPSEANLAILKAATDAYQFALDPEKKTEDEADHKPKTEASKPAAAPKPVAPKASAQKAATAPKVEATPVATQPVQPEQSAPQSQEQQPVSETQPAQETATTAASDPA